MSPTDKRIAYALQGAPVLITATVSLMERLAQILITEIDLVTKRKMSEHAVLLKEKQRMAVDYRANIKAIAARPDQIKKLPDAAKEVIREVAQRLAEAADANARMLRAAVDATRQLILNVVSMVKSETMPKQTYKNHAKAHLELGHYSPTCQPVAISRTV